nr:MAG TPA: virion morphogenesis protein [Caudoviricetes sp.]
MSGVSITVDVSGITKTQHKLKPLFEFDGSGLMSAIGALGESQTRRRITDEKTAPSGEAWPPNLKGTSILVESGQHLLGSIAWTSSSDEAEWGAGWEFAHVHQDGAIIKAQNAKCLKVPLKAFGGGGGFAFPETVTIPARPFVGLSDANAAEIVDVVTDHFGALAR